MSKEKVPTDVSKPPKWLSEFVSRTKLIALMNDAFNPVIPDIVIRERLKECAYDMAPSKTQRIKMPKVPQIADEGANPQTP